MAAMAASRVIFSVNVHNGVSNITYGAAKQSGISTCSTKSMALTTPFTGVGKSQPSAPFRQHGSSRINAWFKFGNKNGLDAKGAGIYGSQSRDDFDRDDVEQYFNYMGMLAAEGTYDKMEALLESGMHAVDILLLMAASEGDRPKIEELLSAGAQYTVKDVNGKTALDRAQTPEIRELILAGPKVLT